MTKGHAQRAVSILASAFLTLAFVVFVSPAHTASAAETLRCKSTANIYVSAWGGFRFYPHNEPETGAPQWTNTVEGTAGWDGVLVAGPDGAVYKIKDSGTVEKHRWNGTGFDSGTPQIVATDWVGWNSTPAKFRISADAKGDFYLVTNDGTLWFHRYDPNTGTWDKRVLETGWNKYDQVVASGDGVIWARNPNEANGHLYRYQYHAESQRWLQYANPQGSGWNMHWRILASGGDVLYGLTHENQRWPSAPADAREHHMVWYRYIPETNSWQGGTYNGWGWNDDWSIIAAPDSCGWIGGQPPVRPGTPDPADRAPSLVQASDGRVHHAFVDGAGYLFHGRQTNLTDPTLVSSAGVPGVDGLTGGASLAIQEDGRIQALATSESSEVYSALQPGKDQAFTGAKQFGGFAAGSPTAVRAKNGLLTSFVVDGKNGLWSRSQTAPNTEAGPWRPVTARLPGTAGAPGPVIASGQVTAIADGDHIQVVVRDVNGVAHVGTHLSNGTIPGWTSIGSPAGTTVASGVSASITRDGTVQVFARGADGHVYTKRQGVDGTWTGAWVKVGTLKFAGQPTTLTSSTGITYVVARGVDNYVYETGTTMPGGANFRTWNVVKGGDFDLQASSDPGSVAVANGNWVMSYKDVGGELIVVHAKVGASASAQSKSMAVEAAPTAATAVPEFAVTRNEVK